MSSLEDVGLECACLIMFCLPAGDFNRLSRCSKFFVEASRIPASRNAEVRLEHVRGSLIDICRSGNLETLTGLIETVKNVSHAASLRRAMKKRYLDSIASPLFEITGIDGLQVESRYRWACVTLHCSSEMKFTFILNGEYDEEDSLWQTFSLSVTCPRLLGWGEQDPAARRQRAGVGPASLDDATALDPDEDSFQLVRATRSEPRGQEDSLEFYDAHAMWGVLDKIAQCTHQSLFTAPGKRGDCKGPEFRHSRIDRRGGYASAAVAPANSFSLASSPPPGGGGRTAVPALTGQFLLVYILESMQIRRSVLRSLRGVDGSALDLTPFERPRLIRGACGDAAVSSSSSSSGEEDSSEDEGGGSSEEFDDESDEQNEGGVAPE